MADTAILILAAGTAARMGSPKQLLPYGETTLVRHAAMQALASSSRPVAVVVGANANEVIGALTGLDLEIIHNPDWAQGIGTSIQAGIDSLARLPVDNIILTLADQPQLDAAIYDRLARTRLETGSGIVASRYAGTVGVPVLFSRPHFDELLALGPNEGCKGLILRHLPAAVLLDCAEAEADIDTPADYARLHAKP